MEQVETSTRELHTTSERLRAVEGQRLAAVREAEGLRAQVATLQSSGKDAAAALKARCASSVRGKAPRRRSSWPPTAHIRVLPSCSRGRRGRVVDSCIALGAALREEELETLQFQLHELQAGTSAAAAAANLDREAAQRAEERATAAVASLDEARAEATRAHGLAERHQQVSHRRQRLHCCSTRIERFLPFWFQASVVVGVPNSLRCWRVGARLTGSVHSLHLRPAHRAQPDR